jgi:hypothetical protein
MNNVNWKPGRTTLTSLRRNSQIDCSHIDLQHEKCTLVLKASCFLNAKLVCRELCSSHRQGAKEHFFFRGIKMQVCVLWFSIFYLSRLTKVSEERLGESNCLCKS